MKRQIFILDLKFRSCLFGLNDGNGNIFASSAPTPLAITTNGENPNSNNSNKTINNVSNNNSSGSNKDSSNNRIVNKVNNDIKVTGIVNSGNNNNNKNNVVETVTRIDNRVKDLEGEIYRDHCGFHLLNLVEGRQYRAFRCAFGSKNSPAYFKGWIQSIMDEFDSFVLAYRYLNEEYGHFSFNILFGN
ncbi:hypothetical protein ACTA71_007345 [Dictyostelium dimigraforme]